MGLMFLKVKVRQTLKHKFYEWEINTNNEKPLKYNQLSMWADVCLRTATMTLFFYYIFCYLIQLLNLIYLTIFLPSPMSFQIFSFSILTQLLSSFSKNEQKPNTKTNPTKPRKQNETTPKQTSNNKPIKGKHRKKKKKLWSSLHAGQLLLNMNTVTLHWRTLV